MLGTSFWAGSNPNLQRTRYPRSVVPESRAQADLSEGRIGDLSTAFNTGLTIGAFTWGLLVDILGVGPLIRVRWGADGIEEMVFQHHLYIRLGIRIPLCG